MIYLHISTTQFQRSRAVFLYRYCISLLDQVITVRSHAWIRKLSRIFSVPSSVSSAIVYHAFYINLQSEASFLSTNNSIRIISVIVK